jgi:hypothetical protein
MGGKEIGMVLAILAIIVGSFSFGVAIGRVVKAQELNLKTCEVEEPALQFTVIVNTSHPIFCIEENISGKTLCGIERQTAIRLGAWQNSDNGRNFTRIKD